MSKIEEQLAAAEAAASRAVEAEKTAGKWADDAEKAAKAAKSAGAGGKAKAHEVPPEHAKAGCGQTLCFCCGGPARVEFSAGHGSVDVICDCADGCGFQVQLPCRILKRPTPESVEGKRDLHMAFHGTKEQAKGLRREAAAQKVKDRAGVEV